MFKIFNMKYLNIKILKIPNTSKWTIMGVRYFVVIVAFAFVFVLLLLGSKYEKFEIHFRTMGIVK